MDVPVGIDLSWPTITFLGGLVVAAFLGAWKLFNIRNNDHVKIDNNLTKAVKGLKDELIKEIKTLDSKIDGKFDATVNAIGRVETNAKEDYSVLHGRVNRSVEELGDVESKVEYQRGVTDTMKDFMLKGK